MTSQIPKGGNTPATPATPVVPVPEPVVIVNSSNTTAEQTEKQAKLLALSLERLEEILTLVEESQTGASAVTVGTGLHEVLSFVKTELTKDPSNVSKVLQTIAPLLKPDAKNLQKSFKLLYKLISELKQDLNKLSPEQYEKDFNQHLKPVFDGVGKKLQALDKALGQHDSKTYRSYSEDPTISSLFNSDSQVSTDLIGQAAMFMQMFMCASAESQADKSKSDSIVGGALVTQAQNNLKQVQDEIQKAEEAARHRPFWEKLVQVASIVLSVVVGAFTGGVGGFLTAGLMAAFMSSPLFNDAVSAIAKAVASALEPVMEAYYESKGESKDQAKQDAEASSDAIGQIVGKITMTIAMAVATLGVGGITAGVEAAAEEGATVAAEESASVAADDAATTAASTAAKSSSKLGYSLEQGAKLAKFQGFSTFMSSGIWSDAMDADPNFVKNHQKLVLGLNIACTIVGAALTIYTGSKIMSGPGDQIDRLEKLARSFRYIIPASYAMQAAEGGVSGYEAYMSGKALESQADAQSKLAVLEAFATVINSALDSANFTQKSSTDSINEISKNMADAMSQLVRTAGIAYDRVSSNLAS
jgi:hypothetical protein